MGFHSKPLIHNKCPSGYSKRKGYTRKNTGKYVKAACIKKEKTPYSIKKTRKVRCGHGTILRHAFDRHTISKRNGTYKTTRIQATCVKKPKTPKQRALAASKMFMQPQMPRARKTLKVKTPKEIREPVSEDRIGPLRKGELKRFGYAYKLPEQVRHESIRKAMMELGALNVYRKLDAVAKLSLTQNPDAAKVFAADRDWIRNNYVLKAK